MTNKDILVHDGPTIDEARSILRGCDVTNPNDSERRAAQAIDQITAQICIDSLAAFKQIESERLARQEQQKQQLAARAAEISTMVNDEIAKIRAQES